MARDLKLRMASAKAVRRGANIARLRHMVINAMQKEGSKGSLRGKFKRAGWDNDYLLRLLELF